MDITVVDAHGLPNHAFLSVRVGETKRLKPFRPGEAFSFAKGQDANGYIQLDVYEKIGSHMMHAVDEVTANETDSVKNVNIPLDNGRQAIAAKIKVAMTQPKAANKPSDASGTKHQLAIAAKKYMDLYDVWGAVQGMLAQLLNDQPADPLGFMLGYITNLHQGRIIVPTADAYGVDPFPVGGKSFSIGGDEAAGFPVDECPASMPDLSQHHSIMAAVLRCNLDIYQSSSKLVTKSGVTSARCLKPGMDITGSPDVPTVGVVAGDEESYAIFRDVFDPVISRWHSRSADHCQSPDAKHPTDLQVEGKVAEDSIDPSGRYVVSTRIRGGRNVSGFRFPTACGREERTEIERIVEKAVESLRDEDLEGEYFPLTGMDPEDEADLESHHLLFQKPTSELQIAKGVARHWPESRGVFAAESKQLVCWVNEEDHMRFISMGLGSDLRGTFSRYARAVTGVEATLRKMGHAYAYDEHLGYLSSCPSNLGTGLRVSVMMRLPHMAQRSGFHQVCDQLGLAVRISPELCELTNSDRLGVSEVEIVNTVIAGCQKLGLLEQQCSA